MNHRNKSHLKSVKKSGQRNRKSKFEQAVSRHHIMPRSRGGKDDDSNISRIIFYHHKLYHMLFSNMTPIEILAFLDLFFFSPNNCIELYHFSKKATSVDVVPLVQISPRLNNYYGDLFHSLFKDMNPFEICSFLENYFWNQQFHWLQEYISYRDYYLDLINDKQEGY